MILTGDTDVLGQIPVRVPYHGPGRHLGDIRSATTKTVPELIRHMGFIIDNHYIFKKQQL